MILFSLTSTHVARKVSEVSVRVAQALSRRRVHGVHTGVLANGSASFQSHAIHIDQIRHFYPNRADPRTKDLQANSGPSWPVWAEHVHVREILFLSRARERVWSSTCGASCDCFRACDWRRSPRRSQTGLTRRRFPGCCAAAAAPEAHLDGTFGGGLGH